MPQFQMLPRIPSLGTELGRALGEGFGGGISQTLADFHQKKEREKEIDSLLPFVKSRESASSILNAPSELRKPLLYQELFNSLTNQSPDRQEINSENEVAPRQERKGLKALTDEQLTSLLANPIAEKAAQQELKERGELKKDIRKSDIKRSEKFLDEINDSRDNTNRAKNALTSIEDALEQRNLGFFSPDNLKSMAGFERWISPEGAILNTAAKEFFLADLKRMTGRPNMFLERILSSAIPQIGKSNEANKTIVEFYKNAIDIEEEKQKISDRLEDYYRVEMGYVPGNIGRLVDAQLKPYAQQKEKELTKLFQKKEGTVEGQRARNKSGQEIIFEKGKWKKIK